MLFSQYPYNSPCDPLTYLCPCHLFGPSIFFFFFFGLSGYLRSQFFGIVGKVFFCFFFFQYPNNSPCVPYT